MNVILFAGILAIILFVAIRNRGGKQSFTEIQDRLQKGALLLDVRTPTEFNSSHAVGAKNIPLQQLQAGTLPAVSKDDFVYVYCHSGGRASVAKALLKRAGYKQVANIGGLRKWQSLGGKVTN